MDNTLKLNPIDALTIEPLDVPGAKGKPSFFDDIEAIRMDTSALALGVQEIATGPPVRKPSRQEFFRVHPDPSMSLITSVYVDQDQRETHYVPPRMRDALLGEARAALLLPAITAQNVLMIWPLMLSLDSGRRNGWADTAQEAVEYAKKDWVRMSADMALGGYRVYRAQGSLPDPKWPEKSLQELLDAAFRDLVIDSEDHPVIRRLRGLV